MSMITSNSSQAALPATSDEVLLRVTELVPTLRSRGRETEQLRRMHPDNLRDLTEAGVFKLTMPADVGGYEADDYVVTEVLTQIARGCPSTSWICSIMLSVHILPALLSDDVADLIYATPDLRITATLAPTGRATAVDGGYRVTGKWKWNTGSVHANWVVPSSILMTDAGPMPIMTIIPTSQVQQQDNWHAAGMAGTATNILKVTDVFVPASFTVPNGDLIQGRKPAGRYRDSRYFSRPFVMWACMLSAPTLFGAARGAMDVFSEVLSSRGAITYTPWTKAAEAPLLHHQLAKAQFELEIAEMYQGNLRSLLGSALVRTPTVFERVQARACLGQVATHARACVNGLFEASAASEVTLGSDLQRYFRDINVLHQHGLIQPRSSDELYGRLLAGLEPDTHFY
jgi:3-hydroxy-9,10-secoandrosta-1,3,5(10)-triene-9,17-dione monooxygenase